MPCMGPDYDHAKSMAKRMTETIIKVLAENGIERPKDCHFGPNLERAWDSAVDDLENDLCVLLEINADAKF